MARPLKCLVVTSITFVYADCFRATPFIERTGFKHSYDATRSRASDKLTWLRTLLLARPRRLLGKHCSHTSGISDAANVQRLFRIRGGTTTNATTVVGVKRVEANIDYVKKHAKTAHSLFSSHRELALVLIGLLGLFYGGSTPFTVLFLQSFGKTGLPVMRTAVRRARSAYAEAKISYEPLRRQLLDLAAELARLRREGASEYEQEDVIQQMRRVRKQLQELPAANGISPVLVAMHEPTVVRDLILGVWSGVILSLSAACHNAARTMGIGISLGEFVSKAGTVLLAKAELALRKRMSSLPGEAVMLAYLGPSLTGAAIIGLLGRWLGFWLARRLQNVAVVLSVSLLFARMLMQAVEPFLSAVEVTANVNKSAAVSNKVDMKQWQETLVWMLAIGALQNQRSRNFKLPMILKIPFLPMLGIEALLQELADRMNSQEGFPFMPGTPQP